MKTIVELKTLGNQWNQKRLKKATDACLLIEKVINTAQFKEAILSANMTNKNGKTNAEIYELIMKSVEIKHHFNGADEYVLNIEYNLIYRGYFKRLLSKVMGFGYANLPYFNTYVDVFDRLDLPNLAGHIYHEHSGHKVLGMRDTTLLQTDVPYAIGAIVVKLAREMK
jgi:hypothetical protein